MLYSSCIPLQLWSPSLKPIVPAHCHALWYQLQLHSWLFAPLVCAKSSFTPATVFAWVFLCVFFSYFGSLIRCSKLETIFRNYHVPLCLWNTDHYSLTPYLANSDDFWHFLVFLVLPYFVALFLMFCCVVFIQFILTVFCSSFCCSIWPTGLSWFHLCLLLTNPIIPY